VSADGQLVVPGPPKTIIEACGIVKSYGPTPALRVRDGTVSSLTGVKI
jgi:hypothetical protein